MKIKQNSSFYRGISPLNAGGVEGGWRINYRPKIRERRLNYMFLTQPGIYAQNVLKKYGNFLRAPLLFKKVLVAVSDAQLINVLFVFYSQSQHTQGPDDDNKLKEFLTKGDYFINLRNYTTNPPKN